MPICTKQQSVSNLVSRFTAYQYAFYTCTCRTGMNGAVSSTLMNYAMFTLSSCNLLELICTNLKMRTAFSAILIVRTTWTKCLGKSFYLIYALRKPLQFNTKTLWAILSYDTNNLWATAGYLNVRQVSATVLSNPAQITVNSLGSFLLLQHSSKSSRPIPSRLSRLVR